MNVSGNPSDRVNLLHLVQEKIQDTDQNPNAMGRLTKEGVSPSGRPIIGISAGPEKQGRSRKGSAFVQMVMKHSLGARFTEVDAFQLIKPSFIQLGVSPNRRICITGYSCDYMPLLDAKTILNCAQRCTSYSDELPPQYTESDPPPPYSPI